MTTDPYTRRGGVSRAEAWAVPDQDWPGWWHIMIGVHDRGRYSEKVLTTGGSLLEEEALRVLRSLTVELSPDGRTLALTLDPSGSL